MGIWPTEGALNLWIQNKWTPKGEIKLQLGSKGFFIVIFDLLEDRYRIFEGGPYFYNSVGLYMRFWKDNFTLEKENFMRVPVWVRLYSLPIDYWPPSVLKGIGDELGEYIKMFEGTRTGMVPTPKSAYT